MSDGSLAPRTLADARTGAVAPNALIEACGLPEIGLRLADMSVRCDVDLAAPMRVEDIGVTLRADVAECMSSAAVALREAIELRALGARPDGWPQRILAHVTALAYHATGLRRHIVGDPDGAIRSGVLVPGLPLDVLLDDPTRVAAIAEHLTRRDQSPVHCPDAALAAAARGLRAALPTDLLLAEGGDDRQHVDWDTGTNSYGIATRPNPWCSSFGSCTASSPTFRAFNAARDLRHRLIQAAIDDRLHDEAELEAETTRTTILAALGVGPDQDVEVVLTPSGTDAELLALAVSLVDAPSVHSVLVGPVEVGRGSAPAARGRHFTASLPSGGRAQPGAAVEGFPVDRVTVAEVPVRHDDGRTRAPAEVEADVRREIDRSSGRVLVHVVEGSKTGIRLPRAAVVTEWQRDVGPQLDVVVDAAQMRIDQATVGAHLAEGRMIFVTGSKFFGGPPFSGALLLPPALARRVRNAAGLPSGLGGFISRTDVPPSLPTLRATARPGANFGLLARWAAALDEMRSFHNASPQIRDEVLRVLAGEVRTTLASAPHVEVVESPYTGAVSDDHRGLDDLPTIFTFLVRHPSGRLLDLDEVGAAHRLLRRDLSPFLDARDAPALATRTFHLGQPVKVVRDGERWTAGLRFALGAPTISQIVFDHTRGPHWSDRIRREVSEIDEALAKLALITQRIDLRRAPC